MGVVGVHARGIDHTLAGVPEHGALALAAHQPIEVGDPLVLVVSTIVDTLTVGCQRGVSELLFGERDDDVRAAALFEQLVNENEITAIGG